MILLKIILFILPTFVVAQQKMAPVPEKSKAPTLVKSVYYTPENLQKLKNQGIPYHLPCMIIIDPERLENPNSKSNHLTLTFRLGNGLLSGLCAIICNKSIAYNLFYRLEHPISGYFNNLPALQKTSYSFSEWEIYDSIKSPFVLFVPRKYKKFFEEGLSISENKDLVDFTSEFGPSSHDNYLMNQYLLKTWENAPQSSSSSFLTELFKSKQTAREKVLPIWDLLVNGHGNYQTYIAGLDHTNINRLLSIFDNYINTGVVCIESCYAGGKNLSLLQISKSGIQLSHNYVLIVASSTDQPTFLNSLTYKFINRYSDFFTNAAQLVDKGESLNTLMKDLVSISFHYQPHGGTEGIPQVWLPNGMGFQTLNLNNDILTIGNVLVTTAQENKRPIIIKNKRVALIYSNPITAPIIVEPTIITPDIDDKTSFTILSAKAKQWGNFAMPWEASFWKGISKEQAIHFAQKLKSENLLFPPTQDIFPQFLLMGGLERAYFKEIQVNSAQNSTAGVLQFIREAFFDVKYNPVEKVIYIDSLTGYNDIALFLRTSMLKNELLHTNEKLPSELIQNFNQRITLENIRIIIHSDNYFYVYFELYNSIWRLQIGPDKWEIEKGPTVQNYRSEYARLKSTVFPNEKPNQKSISDVLKLKQLKQQELLKTKPGAST